MKPEEVISETIKTIVKAAKVGVSLIELESMAETSISIMGAESYNKGYHPKWAPTPFPSVICLGVNDVIAHPIPTPYVLKNGDLLHIDIGIRIDGICGDAGMTIPIGEVSNKDKHLLKYARQALYVGIEQIKSGVDVNEIGKAIQHEILTHNFVVNRVFRGHAINKDMHESPFIPHFEVENKKWNPTLRKYEDIPTIKETLTVGQIVCVEPMITYKDDVGYIDRNGWTVRTRDHRKSAFFEHMIRVEQNGYTVLTTHFKKGGVDL